MLDHKQHIEREIHMIENPEVSAVNSIDYETSVNKEEAPASGVSALSLPEISMNYMASEIADVPSDPIQMLSDMSSIQVSNITINHGD